MDVSSRQMTQLLLESSNGNRQALDQLIPTVYGELRRLAHRYLSRERAGHTLQTTALINEAYLRLIDQRNVEWQNRAHFLGVAAEMMRRILVDHARSRKVTKRGGETVQVSLDESAFVSRQKAAEILVLDEALGELAAIDPRKSKIVELRFFGGLTIEETAQALRISTPTVEREWRSARAWLYRAVGNRQV